MWCNGVYRWPLLPTADVCKRATGGQNHQAEGHGRADAGVTGLVRRSTGPLIRNINLKKLALVFARH